MLAIREPSKRSRSNYPGDHQVSIPRHEDRHFDGFLGSFGPPSIFSDDPFSSMNRMMDRMHQMANNMFSHFEDMSSMHMPSMHMASDFSSGPQFYSQTIVQSTKYDSNGRPIVEKYRSEAKGAVDSERGLVGERKQAYAHSGTGLEKYGHERMIGNKGRKVVKEKIGNCEKTSDVYKNMGQEDAFEFDRHWTQLNGGNALPVPSGNIYGRNNDRVTYDDRKVDDRRRGDYIPQNWRAENQPVRRTDIQPTIPAQRAAPIRANVQALPGPAAPVQRRNPPRNPQPRRAPAAGS